MKFGMRKPSLTKSFKARTTAKYKRQVKKALIPGYGKKGTGIYKSPKKHYYNKIYNKTTFSVNPLSTTKTQKNNTLKKGHSSVNTPLNNSKFQRYRRVPNKTDKLLLSILSFSLIMIIFIPILLIPWIVFAIWLLLFTLVFETKVSVTDAATGQTLTMLKNEYQKLIKDYKAEVIKYSYIPVSYQIQTYNSLLSQAKESSKLIDKTVNPIVFFERYDFVLDRLEKLIELFKDPRINWDKAEIVSIKETMINNKSEVIDNLLERSKNKLAFDIKTLKTDRGKQNRIEKTKLSFDPFKSHLSSKQIKEIEKWDLIYFK